MFENLDRVELAIILKYHPDQKKAEKWPKELTEEEL